MSTYENRAFVIVDAQNDFINGSLAVPNGERSIAPINEYIRACGRYGILIATTQDEHPHETAHFADEPNYVDTWPRHCVAGSHGAELYPTLEVAQHSALARRFIKGTEACASPADDNSYSGVFAFNPETGIHLPDWLEMHNIEEVDVAGYAIGDGDVHKLCVDSTAVDLNTLGYKVNVITDAVEEVLPENRELCLHNLGLQGIRLTTLAQALKSLQTLELQEA